MSVIQLIIMEVSLCRKAGPIKKDIKWLILAENDYLCNRYKDLKYDERRIVAEIVGD